MWEHDIFWPQQITLKKICIVACHDFLFLCLPLTARIQCRRENLGSWEPFTLLASGTSLCISPNTYPPLLHTSIPFLTLCTSLPSHIWSWPHFLPSFFPLPPRSFPLSGNTRARKQEWVGWGAGVGSGDRGFLEGIGDFRGETRKVSSARCI